MKSIFHQIELSECLIESPDVVVHFAGLKAVGNLIQ